MKKVMISQPMSGLPDDIVVETKRKAEEKLNALGYEVINTLFADEWESDESLKKKGVANIPVSFLASSLAEMAKCDAVYFCKGWDEARGCRIEHAVAEAYGFEMIYEEDLIDEN